MKFQNGPLSPISVSISPEGSPSKLKKIHGIYNPVFGLLNDNHLTTFYS